MPQRLRDFRILVIPFLIEFLFLFSIVSCSDSFRVFPSSTELLSMKPTSLKATRLYSAMKSSYIHPAALSTSYPGVPGGIEMEKLVVIHRHGDRAQISKTIGGKKRPYSQINSEVTAYWRTALPSEDTLQKLERVASHGMIKQPYQGTASPVAFESDLYSGWDKDNYPYSQLTEVGAQQLMAVGRRLRQRYGHFYHPDTNRPVVPSSLGQANDHLLCRSTNICRTIQSLRSLLVGLFEHEFADEEKNRGDSPSQDEENWPMIYTRPREYENVFPQVDGDCPAMASRRAIIFPHDLTKKTIPGYETIEQRMMEILGYEDRVNWLTVKEVLTCHYVHNIKQIPDIEDEDVHKATEIAGWTWGVLYKDDLLNKFAIGRFIDDVLNDISPSETVQNSLTRNKTCFIYSGHDSTLVPVMCGLGIYDDKWPDYGAFLCWEIAKDKATGKRMIRVVYNDSVMELNKIPGTPSPFQSSTPVINSISFESQDETAKGWYWLEDFEKFVDRIRIDHDAYMVESRTHYHPAGISDEDMKKAEDEAAQEGADDLTATLAAPSVPSNEK